MDEVVHGEHASEDFVVGYLRQFHTEHCNVMTPARNPQKILRKREVEEYRGLVRWMWRAVYRGPKVFRV